MKIYVQSCGVSEKHDYCWQEITKNSQQRVKEPILINKFIHLLQTEVASILLVRENRELVLLVTGIKASQRTDYMGRTIRISVAWVAEDSDENEKQLRTVAVSALRNLPEEDSLAKQIDDAVKPCNKEGFKVDNFEAIKAENLGKNVTVGNSTPDPISKIGKSDKQANELVKELEECCLPKQKDLIVVVTGIKAPSALEKAGVWRGLSNLVQGEGWKDYKKNNALIFLVIFIVVIWIAIILYLLLSQPQPKPNQETQSLSQPVSPSAQPTSSPSPPSQLLENKLNATKTSKSQDRETVNTSNSVSQAEATKGNYSHPPCKIDEALDLSLKGEGECERLQQKSQSQKEIHTKLTETKTSEPIKQQILTEAKVDSQLLQQPIDKTLPSKLVEPIKNSSDSSEKSFKPNI